VKERLETEELRRSGAETTVQVGAAERFQVRVQQ
jgi:hypothetical protein